MISGILREEKRLAPRGQSVGQPFCVSLRLGLNTGERDPLLLGLDNSCGSAIDVEKVVGKAVARFQGEVADRNAPIRQYVRVALIAHDPAGLGEQAVDVFSGFIFRGGHFGLAILLRPSHESLLLRGGGAEWGYQKLRGLRRSVGAPFQPTKLAAYYAIWRAKYKCRDRDGDWKTTVAGGGSRRVNYVAFTALFNSFESNA